MAVTTRNCRIALSADIGALTPEKLDLLHPNLRPKYPLMARDSGADTVVLADLGRTKSIILQPNQLIFNFGEGLIPVDGKAVLTDLKEICDQFILNRVIQLGTIRLIGTVPARDDDAMAGSLQLLPYHLLGGVDGVGLRFLFNKGDQIWEYKIEPFLKDRSYFYIEAVSTFKNFAINRIPELIDYSYSFYRDQWQRFEKGLTRNTGNRGGVKILFG